MSWQNKVIGYLVELRAQGYTFQDAWAKAMVRHPPRGRDAGESVPRLFDEDGDAETVHAFFRRVASNAWHDRVDAPGSGNGPRLRHFRPEMLVAVDEQEPVYVRRTAA